jgi:esterase/lipase
MQHLLLLHGAIGAKDQLQNLAEKLEDDFYTHTSNFSGHGGERFPKEDFSIPLFAKEVVSYLEQNNIQQANIFGYSMGGYVGMYLAKHNSKLIHKVITLATKFHWDIETAAKETRMLNAELMLEKIPAFVEQLKQRHAPNDWRLLLERTKEMLRQLGENNTLKPEDYKDISTPCLILLGDKDKMITVEETVAVNNALLHSEFKILPKTPHPIEQVDVDMLSSLIKGFLNK